MKNRTSITLSKWMKEEVIGSTDNVSGRIQELIYKGYLHEKMCSHAKASPGEREDGVFGILSPDSCVSSVVVQDA